MTEHTPDSLTRWFRWRGAWRVSAVAVLVAVVVFPLTSTPARVVFSIAIAVLATARILIATTDPRTTDGL